VLITASLWIGRKYSLRVRGHEVLNWLVPECLW